MLSNSVRAHLCEPWTEAELWSAKSVLMTILQCFSFMRNTAPLV